MQFFVTDLIIPNNRSVYQFHLNADNQRTIFLFKLVYCAHEYKIRFCKKNFTLPLTSKTLFLEIMHNIRGSCAALHDDRFANFTFS